MVERYGANTVCVDYVSLMESQRKASSDWERVKDVSQSLKRMANDMGIRVYAAAQNSKDAALNGPTEDNIAYSSAIFRDRHGLRAEWTQAHEWPRLGIRDERGTHEWDRDRMVFEPWLF
jgi:replicative DNA helicase